MTKPSSSRQVLQMRILLAANDSWIADATRLLEEEGFELADARSGASLLRAVMGQRHDLVVLDLDLLPDSFTALRRLGRAHPHLPVVVVSARADLPTKLLCFEFGALDYLVKPYSDDEFAARIRAQLRVAGSSRGVLTAGRLALDVTARQARIDREVIDLTERECQLLRCLIRNAGKLVTRESLLAEIWGRTFDGGSNVLDACVLRLRKKLGPRVPITTIRRVGYRLASESPAS
jgi:two-component system, OmpR family, response regulator